MTAEEDVGAGTWPGTPNTRVVFLLDAKTPVEQDLLRRWIRNHRPLSIADELVTLLPLVEDDIERVAGIERLAEQVADERADTHFAPLRVMWMPPSREGNRKIRLADFIRSGNPRLPRASAQARIAAHAPERWRVLVGESAQLGQLRQRWSVRGDDADPRAFARFVGWQAVLALERAESQALGRQYKVPRLVREEISASARFRLGLRELAKTHGRDESSVVEEASKYLGEMVTGWGRVLVDATVQTGRFVLRQGYDEQIDYDEAQVVRLRAATANRAAVILMSHRSNLDAGILPVALHEIGLPRAHGLAGINMAFWPLGAVMRRAGVIFIRRDTRDLPVYRFVLREYVGYLVEKKFNLQWALEGTRSRTGKMLPPRLGLLAYVADAYLEGRTPDVVIAPVSITYDRMHEVGEYAAYAAGGEKKKEGIGWLMKFARAQRGHYGKVYMRFAEPVSLREALGPPGGEAARNPAAKRLALQKVAFEISWLMNQVTPITAASVVSSTLLAAQGRALTIAQVAEGVRGLLDYARCRDLPLAASAEQLDSADGVLRALTALVTDGVVRGYQAGLEPVYTVDPGKEVAVSVYRNSAVHFVLDRSIAELALLRAADAGGEPLSRFWDEAFELRDMLKFEFFFEDKERFRTRIVAEMELLDPEWERRVAAGADEIARLLAEMWPLTAYASLRSFLEAYRIVADVLTREPSTSDAARCLERSLAVGRQYLLQRRVHSAESVSGLLFATGVQLAGHRGLLDGGDDVFERRKAFAAQLHDIVRRADQIGLIASRQLASGLREGA